MTHKKRHNTKKMVDLKNEKVEVGHELGFYGSSETEVNAKIASQGEPAFSNKTNVKSHNLSNKQKTDKKNYKTK